MLVFLSQVSAVAVKEIGKIAKSGKKSYNAAAARFESWQLLLTISDAKMLDCTFIMNRRGHLVVIVQQTEVVVILVHANLGIQSL